MWFVCVVALCGFCILVLAVLAVDAPHGVVFDAF